TLGTRAFPPSSRTTTGRPSRTYAARLNVVPRSMPTTAGAIPVTYRRRGGRGRSVGRDAPGQSLGGAPTGFAPEGGDRRVGRAVGQEVGRVGRVGGDVGVRLDGRDEGGRGGRGRGPHLLDSALAKVPLRPKHRLGSRRVPVDLGDDRRRGEEIL